MEHVKPQEELFKILDSVQIRELLVSLSTLRDIPLKFEYLGRGAEHWAHLAEERKETGGINAREIEVWRLGENILAYELDGRDFVHVVDIGCGTGEPAFLAMDILEKEGISFDYVAVDISKEMIQLARENVEGRYGVEAHGIVVDLENNVMPLPTSWNEPTLFLFLGSTIVNFDWPLMVMDRIRRHMLGWDVLAMSTVIARNFSSSEVEEELSFYTSQTAKTLTTYIPTLLNIPFTFKTRWNDTEHRFENYIVIERDVLLGVGSYRVPLRKGEEILVAFSRRYTYDEMTNLMHRVRFLTEHTITTRDRKYMLGFYTVGKG